MTRYNLSKINYQYQNNIICNICSEIAPGFRLPHEAIFFESGPPLLEILYPPLKCVCKNEVCTGTVMLKSVEECVGGFNLIFWF